MNYSEIERMLHTSLFGHPFIYKKELASTNGMLLDLAGNGAKEGTVVATAYQTAGRGTRGNKWIAPAGKNMSLSLLCRPGVPAVNGLKFTLMAAIVLRKAILTFPDFKNNTKPSILFKWPNDLLVGRKKLAGILLESTVRENRLDVLVAGFGLNINSNSQKLSAKVEREVVSLVDLFGCTIDIPSFYIHFLQVFETAYFYYMTQNLNNVIADWEMYSALQNSFLKILDSGEIHGGYYCGLDADGFLCYRTKVGALKKLIGGRVIDWGGTNAVSD